MRWFKHMSCSSDDEKLAELIADCGLEGYGFWWRLLEIVAAQMGKGDNKCSVTYTLAHWSRLFYCHHNKVSKYLGKLEVIGIVTLEYNQSKVTVTIPNLLKYRDEYSKKSGQDKDGVGTKKEREKKKIESETELDPDPNPEDKTLSSSDDEGDVWISKKKRKLTGKREETFKMFWEAFAYKAGRATAIDAWLDIPNLTMAKVDEIVKAAKAAAENRPKIKASGGTPKMAQGWLSESRWEDEREPEAWRQNY